MSFSVHFLGRGSERMCRHFVHYGSLASDCCFITYRFWQICISPELPNRFLGSLPKQASDFSGRQIVFLGGQCSVHPSSKLLKLQKNWTFDTWATGVFSKKIKSSPVVSSSPQKRGWSSKRFKQLQAGIPRIRSQKYFCQGFAFCQNAPEFSWKIVISKTSLIQWS